MSTTTFRLAMLLAISACGGPQGDAGSEGSASRVSGELVAEQLVVIPDELPTGEVVFESVAGATRLRDGTIVLGDRYGASLRYFASDGRPLRTSGRPGGGPGEFSAVDWVGQCEPDLVYAWDQTRGMMSVFDQGGGFVRSFRPPEAFAAPLGCYVTGSIALLTAPDNWAPPGPDGSSEHFRSNVLVIDKRGRLTHSIMDVPGFETRPAGKVTVIATDGELVFVGTKDSATIDVYSRRGDRLTPIRLELDRRPPTREHYQRAVEVLLAPSHSRAFREQWRERLLRIPMPELLNPYHAVFVDREGILWIQTSIPGDPETALRAVGLDGEVLATVTLPGDFVVYEVGLDYVLAVSEDLESGRQTVHVFALRAVP